MAADYPAFLPPCGYAFDPVANARCALEYIRAWYSEQPPRPFAAGGVVSQREPARRPRPRPVRREYVCVYCERGQCARCNDQACTCCYGNED